jgi:hypothetical protein
MYERSITMPMLHIDGVAIAEIDHTIADRLLILAKPGLGIVRASADLSHQVKTSVSRPSSQIISTDLTLEFPVPD